MIKAIVRDMIEETIICLRKFKVTLSRLLDPTNLTVEK